MNRLVALGLVGLMVALASVGELTAQAPKKEEIGKFIMNLKDKDAKTRIDGCKGIAAIGKLKASYAKDAIEPLMELVKKDTEAKVRAAAASALGSCDPEDKEAVTVLIAALKEDKDKDVRTAAATGLGQLGAKAKEALPALKEAAAMAKADGDKKTSKALGTATKAIQSQLK
jgi:HEAT repeats